MMRTSSKKYKLSVIINLFITMSLFCFPFFHTVFFEKDFKDTNTFCTCVDCKEDKNCGSLWSGVQVFSPEVSFHQGKKIIAIVSHCLHDLFWMANFTYGFQISEFIIVSKCGQDVVGAPSRSTMIRHVNNGRCDHTYAYFIAYLRPTIDYDIAIFLKDDRSDENIHIRGMWRSLSSMLQISSTNGFACGMKPIYSPELGSKLSAYHVNALLKQFSLEEYMNRVNFYGAALMQSEFKSEFKNLGEWLSFVGGSFSDNLLVEVCYGGTFLATKDRIASVSMNTWKNIESSLSRGNNIQEGHYAERAWAGLLSFPLVLKWKEEAVLNYTGGIANLSTSFVGTLLHILKPARPRYVKAILDKSYLANFLQ